MATIRFKSRSLLRRFGSDPVEVSESLAKQYTDRGQAIYVREKLAKKEEEVEEEVVEEEAEEEEVKIEDEIEVKIKKKK